MAWRVNQIADKAVALPRFIRFNTDDKLRRDKLIADNFGSQIISFGKGQITGVRAVN